MSKDAVISARIDPDIKHNAEKVFKELGLTSSQAITLFYKQVELQHGLPFEVRIPNKVTQQAIEDAKTRRNLKSYNSMDELLEDLEI